MDTAGLLPPVVNPLPIPNIISGPFEGNLRNFPHVDSILEFFNITLMPMIGMTLLGQEYAPKTTSCVNEEYDIIIVGGGAAGCVLANRLSAMSNISVLLLEAGTNPPLITELPCLSRFLTITTTNYNYMSERQKVSARQLHNNQIPYTAGKGIGGSSLINAMLYIRANHRDYDRWEKMGATGWGWKDVYCLFQRLENNTDLDFLKKECHSSGGPVTASRAGYTSDMREPLEKTCKSHGWDVNVDTNCGNQLGLADHQTFTRRGQRCSMAKAYLVPVDERKNLHIVKEAMVTKIAINPKTKTAEGVYFDNRNKCNKHFVKARREVIISAGALNTPKLLMLSGVGPEKELKKHNIDVIKDLPGVGENFQDHCSSILFFYRPGPSYVMKILNPINILRYIKDRTGPLSSTTGVYALAFNRSKDASTPKDVPNCQLYFIEGENAAIRLTFGLKPEAYNHMFGPYELTATLWCISSTTNPQDRGHIKLNSDDPYAPPKIDPKCFENKQDVDDIVEGFKICAEIAESPLMRNAGVRSFETEMLGCTRNKNLPLSKDTEYLRCYVLAFPFTIGHQSCTAKMGSESDPNAVVTPDLRVIGVNSLRVVDASVMPTVVSGNIMIPTVMIAEKASDMIKQSIQMGNSSTTAQDCM